MNILHVTQNYSPSAGGPQYTMKHLSEKLVDYYSDKVEVCTTDSLYNPESDLYEKVTPDNEIMNGVLIRRLPFNRWHYPLIRYSGKVVGKVFNAPLPNAITKLRWALDSPAINKAMRDSAADVVMATTINYDFCTYPLWRNKTKNPKPFVLYGALHLHKPLAYNHLALVKARACDCYIANTDFEKQTLLNNGVVAEKITTIGTGISLEDYECNENNIAQFRLAQGIEKDDCVLGFVGRLVKGKGVAILLDAIRRMQAAHPNLKLLLAGGTTDFVPIIEKAISEEKLPIILIKDFADEAKPLIFNSIDVFVLPSQSESFGVVFLEAWACRKPVIGTRMGATESLLDHGIDSLLFKGNDVDDLCEQLEVLIGDKPLRNMMGEKGYQKVLAKFTWPTIVAAYRNAYLLGIENFQRAKMDKLSVAS